MKKAIFEIIIILSIRISNTILLHIGDTILLRIGEQYGFVAVIYNILLALFVYWWSTIHSVKIKNTARQSAVNRLKTWYPSMFSELTMTDYNHIHCEILNDEQLNRELIIIDISCDILHARTIYYYGFMWGIAHSITSYILRRLHRFVMSKLTITGRNGSIKWLLKMYDGDNDDIDDHGMSAQHGLYLVIDVCMALIYAVPLLYLRHSTVLVCIICSRVVTSGVYMREHLSYKSDTNNVFSVKEQSLITNVKEFNELIIGEHKFGHGTYLIGYDNDIARPFRRADKMFKANATLPIEAVKIIRNGDDFVKEFSCDPEIDDLYKLLDITDAPYCGSLPFDLRRKYAFCSNLVICANDYKHKAILYIEDLDPCVPVHNALELIKNYVMSQAPIAIIHSGNHQTIMAMEICDYVPLHMSLCKLATSYL